MEGQELYGNVFTPAPKKVEAPPSYTPKSPTPVSTSQETAVGPVYSGRKIFVAITVLSIIVAVVCIIFVIVLPQKACTPSHSSTEPPETSKPESVKCPECPTSPPMTCPPTNAPVTTRRPCKEDCPYLWTAFNDSCYRYFRSHLTWYQAETFCNDVVDLDHAPEKYRNIPCHLTSVRNKEEGVFLQKFIEPYAVGYAYIGFSRTTAADSWRWSDDFSGSYANWRSGNPGTNLLGCMHYTNGQWYGSSTTTKRPYVCKMRRL